MGFTENNSSYWNRACSILLAILLSTLQVVTSWAAPPTEGGRSEPLPLKANPPPKTVLSAGSKATVTPLPLNECAFESLASGDSTFQGGEFFDLYELSFPGQGFLTISLLSFEFNVYAIVYAPGEFPGGNPTIVNDPANPSAIELFELEDAPAGNYTIQVTSNAPAETGNYTLCGLRGAEPLDPGECLTRTLGPPDTTFEVQDIWFPAQLLGSYFHGFYFDWPGGDLTVTLDSAAFDAFLLVLEPPGVPLGVLHAVDNFFPPETETFSMTNAPAGKWSIIASAFSDGEQGDFSICLGAVAEDTPTPTETETQVPTPEPTETETPTETPSESPSATSTATSVEASSTPTPTSTETPTVTETECTGPDLPVFPFPADGATGVPTLGLVLSWNLPFKENSETPPPGIPKPVYGADDRLDIYQVTNDNHLDAYDSSAIQLQRTSLVDNLDGTFTLPQTTLNSKIIASASPPLPALCPDEPFRNQPAPGSCSSFLVGPDILVTAGHCVVDMTDCDTVVWIFGFQMLDANTANITIPDTEIYSCVEILGQSFVENTEISDWAVIRLDRPVEGHDPVPVRRTGKVADTEDLLMVGYPKGLPAKVAAGAVVCNNSPVPHFVANTDSYTGNSGSAVYNADTMQVEGILVRGAQDFDVVGGCTRSAQVPNTGCGESVTRATEFDQLIPPQFQYNIVFGPCPNSQFTGISADSDWQLPKLQPNTTYCWRIVASDGCQTVQGPDWSFTTGDLPTATPTLTPAPSSTVAPTPVATFNTVPDEEINGKDLLILLEGGAPAENLLFDFARLWKANVSR